MPSKSQHKSADRTAFRVYHGNVGTIEFEAICSCDIRECMNFFTNCLKFVSDLFESDEDPDDFNEFTKHTVDKDSITVHAGDELVGAIQSLEYERNLVVSDDGPEWVGTISRIRFSTEKLKHVFHRGQISSHSQREPIELRWSRGELTSVFLTDWKFTYQAGDWIIIEDIGFIAGELKEK